MSNTPSSSYTTGCGGDNGGIRTVRFVAPLASRRCAYALKPEYCHADDRYGEPLTEEQYNALPIEVWWC